MYNLILSGYQKLTSSRGTVSKQTSKLSEPATVTLIREKRLLGHRARDDHRWRKILRARTGRIHAPEGLLQGLESTGNRCSAQVHVLRIGLDLGHEPELVDVKTAETGTQCIGRLATLVGQFTVPAIKWSEIYFHLFPMPVGLVVTYHIASISPSGPVATIASSLSPNASIFRRHWKPFHEERSWLPAAI